MALGFWCLYCAAHSYNPITMIPAVLKNPSGANALFAATNTAVANTVGTSAQSTNAPKDQTSAPNAITGSGSSEGASGTFTTADKAPEEAYAFDLLASKYGITSKAQQQALVKLWDQESGWNPNAKNSSSGAYGIPQALPASKLPNGEKSTAEQQIQWGLSYIMEQYGSPEAAWAKEESAGSY